MGVEGSRQLNGKLLTALKHKRMRMKGESGGVLLRKNTETLPQHVRMKIRKA